MTETDFQGLVDERAVLRGLSRFARILDRKAWSELAEVFAADVSYDYGNGHVGAGLAALTDNMRKYLDVCGGTQHLLGSILVDVDADQAVSRAYVQARHQRRDDPGGTVYDSSGEYVDRWQRRDGHWLIVHRDARWFTQAGDASIIGFGGGVEV